jgi:hypothetical protein
MQWALGVKLSEGRAVDREEILEDYKNGDLTAAAAKAQLIALAQNYGERDMQQFATDNGMSEATFHAIENTLEKLDTEEGVNDKSMAELNSLLDDVRERQRLRMRESGRVSENDKWVDLYGYKYYVPLKGDGSTRDAALDDFSYINENRRSLAKLNQSVKVADGRTSFAELPFNRLFVDTAQSGERAAYKGLMEAVYNLAVNYPKQLGTHIVHWQGTPKDGYTNGTLDGDGELVVYSKIKKTGHGLIYNDGDDHYVIEFPENSQILRGMAGINAVKVPNPVLQTVGKATNVVGRAYTTLSPSWALAKGFLRDWTTIPLSIATENFDTPLQASGFLTRFPVEMVKLYRAAPTFFATMQGNTNAVRELADADPDSYAALLVRYLESGGANNMAEGFEIKTSADMFKGTYDTTSGLWETTKLTGGKVLEFTGNWANFLEQMTRVAAFKALKDSDSTMSDTEAAVKVRRVLDYAMSGVQGRNINSLTAFYRTGMASLDTLRRSFRKPGGGFDAKKFGIWSATYAGIGAAGYMMLAGLMGDDEEKDKDGNIVKTSRISKLKLGTLSQTIPVPIGDKIWGMPLGLGIPQLMLAPGIIAAAISSGHHTMQEGAGEMWNLINRNGPTRVSGMRGVSGELPKDPAGYVYALLSAIPGLNPTIAAPIFSVDRNLDTFGQPIHTQNYTTAKPKYGQAKASTAPEYVEFARTLYDTVGIDMFPEDLKYLATNYAGQNMTDLLRTTIELDNKNMLGENAHYNPITSRFEVKDLDYYDSNDMYDTMDKIGLLDRKYGAINSNARIEGKSAEEARDIANKARAKDTAHMALIKQRDAIKKLIDARRQKLSKLRTDRTLSDARRQAERKRMDSELRQATLKAKYLLEKAQ